MHVLLSCDWGTTSFRLRLVQGNGTVLAEIANGYGIARMHQNWMEENKPETERLGFFQAYLQQQIKALEQQAGQSLSGVPVVLSGMASSTIGMLELPYKKLPFSAEGTDLYVNIVAASEQFANPLVMISGVRSEDDVMRGEETLLVGCDMAAAPECVYIFPGTHSKHIWVRNGVTQQFKTYMTGEFFELLSAKSILANSVEKSSLDDTLKAYSYFEKGIREGAMGNLLNSAFHARTAQLFNTHTPKENYQYLSGLVIGAELKGLVQNPPDVICLVCSEALEKHYRLAFALLGLDKNLAYQNADAALVKGQLRLYHSLYKNTGNTAH